MPQAAAILSEERATNNSRERHPEARPTCRACGRTLRLISTTFVHWLADTRLGHFKRIPITLTLVVAFVASSLVSPASDDPAKTLQAQFEAAKTSLSAGDLASA